MKQTRTLLLGLILLLIGCTATSQEKGPPPKNDDKTTENTPEDQFVSIFNGNDLTGWAGKKKFWSVENGAIVGQTTSDNKAKENTFLVWQEDKPSDFELKLQFKIQNHNSGIQYRSTVVNKKKWQVNGYQADIDYGGAWIGANYDEGGRKVLAKRGKKVVLKKNGERTVTSIGDRDTLFEDHINRNSWNEYHIIANGPRLVHKINGKTMSVVIDHQAWKKRKSGVIALQLHAGPPMKIQFRNIRLRRISDEDQ